LEFFDLTPQLTQLTTVLTLPSLAHESLSHWRIPNPFSFFFNLRIKSTLTGNRFSPSPLPPTFSHLHFPSHRPSRFPETPSPETSFGLAFGVHFTTISLPSQINSPLISPHFISISISLFCSF